MPRLITRILLPAGAALLLGAGAVAISANAVGAHLNFARPAVAATTAATPTPSSGTKAGKLAGYCDKYNGYLAGDLKTSTSNLTAQESKALDQTLAEAVKAGDLTQAQADKIKAAAAQHPNCPVPALDKARGMGHDRSGGELGQAMDAYLNASAAALGESRDELNQQLKGGSSLSQIAAGKNISESTFRSSLLANLKPQLDKAVSDKKITADQETQIINHLQSGPLPLWNKPAHARPAASPSPTA